MVLRGLLTFVLDIRYTPEPLGYYFPLLYGHEVAKMEIDRICKIYYDLSIEYSAKFNIGGYSGSYFESSKYNLTILSLVYDELRANLICLLLFLRLK